MAPRLDEGNDYHPYGGQESHLSNERFTGWKQRLDGYFNANFDANLQRKVDLNFYPKFNNHHVQFYNDAQQKDNRGLNWQFANRQRNYLDQHNVHPTRRDPLFRRNNNLHLNSNGDQGSHLSDERFTGQRQRLYEYAKYPVDNSEFDAKFRRREDWNLYPKFKNQHEQLHTHVQRKDDQRTKWKFTNKQRNYFDQHNVQPTRYDPLFRRNNNLQLNLRGNHRFTEFDYYNQQIDAPRHRGRGRPPKRKKVHFDEYPQQKVYSVDSHHTTERDNSFPSVASLDEKRIPDEDYLQDKKNNVPRNKNGQL